MTEKTLRILLRRKTLTSTQRVQVLREAHRLLNRSINCFYALQDACDTAAEEINKKVETTTQEDKRQTHFEDTRDDFEDLIEYLDNARIPEMTSIR